MDESTPADTTPDEFTPSSHEAEAATASTVVNLGLDLDGIERDLADVEVALARLDAGTYWTDEVTGEPMPAELLELHPTTRRV
jgi:RNA polymerase-binding transcription factor DksA